MLPASTRRSEAPRRLQSTAPCDVLSWGEMLRRFLVLVALLLPPTAMVAAAPPPLTVDIIAVPSPAGPGAMGSSLVTSSEGTVWLSWLEPQGTREHAMKVARFDAAQRKWSEARRVAHGANWFVNWADFPVLAAQGDRLTAVWFVNGEGGDDHAYAARFSVSTDAGKTWTAPAPVTRESGTVEFVALQPLHDGRLLAAWLDGRNRKGHDGKQALFARVIGGTAQDTLVDESVCDCCQLSFVATKTGALLAYRGRTKDEVRDMRVAEFTGAGWQAPRTLHDDGWKIAACPVNGPQLSTANDQVAAIWFTAADGQGRVWAAERAPMATTFGAPARLDLGKPQGRVDALSLADGRTLFTWLEAAANDKQGGIYLRAREAGGALSEPVLLGATTTARASGFPRITSLPSSSGTHFVLSYTRDGEPREIATAVVTLR